MWLLRCICCDCLRNHKSDKAELLSVIKDDDASLKQNYTVRRISSFGRNDSREDIDDSGSDHPETGENCGSSPAEMWTRSLHKIQPVLGSVDTAMDKQRGRWHKALHTLRPKRAKSKEPSKKGLPPITLSSPDIVRDVEKDLTGTKTGADGVPLHHSGNVANMSSVTVVNQQARWLKCQSMQDINSPDSAPIVGEPGDRKETDSTLLARSYGLDTSLYSPVSPQENGTMSRSTEALYAWRISDSMGDCFQELACGTVHFSANYYHKNKKFFVHINKLEGLPPKGIDTEYEIIMKLTILPSNKQSKMSRVLRGSLSPEVEEDFHFSIRDPAGKILRLSVFNADLQGKYDAIGHSLFYLEDVLAGRPRRYTMKLYKQSQPDVVPGSIEIRIQYESHEQKLSVTVLQARNLMAPQVGKNSRLTDKYNTYAKVSLFSAGQKIKSKKSAVVTNTRNPLFNHSYNFLLAKPSLDNSYIVITVMLKSILRKDLPIGRLVMGPNFYAEGSTLTPWGRAILDQDIVSHWFRMYL